MLSKRQLFWPASSSPSPRRSSDRRRAAGGEGAFAGEDHVLLMSVAPATGPSTGPGTQLAPNKYLLSRDWIKDVTERSGVAGSVSHHGFARACCMTLLHPGLLFLTHTVRVEPAVP